MEADLYTSNRKCLGASDPLSHMHTMCTCTNSCAPPGLQTYNTDKYLPTEYIHVHTNFGKTCGLPQSQQLAHRAKGQDALPAHPGTPDSISRFGQCPTVGKVALEWGTGLGFQRDPQLGSPAHHHKWFNLLGAKERAHFQPLSSF